MRSLIKYILLLPFLGLVFIGCEKALDFKPPEDLLEDEAIKTGNDLAMLLNAAYEVTANGFNGQSQNLHNLLNGNLAKPLQHDDYTEVYNRSTNFFNGTISGFYQEPYFAINRANVVIENVDVVSDISEQEKVFLVAQARFLRAFSHFDVVRLFAQPYGYTNDNSHLGIALVMQTTTTPLARATVQEVYDAIISDLNYANENLPADNGNYADKYCAKALLAKVYFQMHEYQLAAQFADEVINSGRYTLGGIDRWLTDQRHPETIFATISTGSSVDNRTGGYSGNYRKGNNPKLTASVDFVNLYFPNGFDTLQDKRAAWFSIINEGQENQRYTIDKFDKDYFNIPLLHLTDIKLLRGEALAEIGMDLSTAIQDINDIIQRAGRIDLLASSADAQTIIARARWERRLEMIAEGDWTDQLKRMGTQGETIVIRDAPWDCPGMLLQFPTSENTDKWVMNPEGGCN